MVVFAEEEDVQRSWTEPSYGTEVTDSTALVTKNKHEPVYQLGQASYRLTLSYDQLLSQILSLSLSLFLCVCVCVVNFKKKNKNFMYVENCWSHTVR